MWKRIWKKVIGASLGGQEGGAGVLLMGWMIGRSVRSGSSGGSGLWAGRTGPFGMPAQGSQEWSFGVVGRREDESQTLGAAGPGEAKGRIGKGSKEGQTERGRAEKADPGWAHLVN